MLEYTANLNKCLLVPAQGLRVQSLQVLNIECKHGILHQRLDLVYFQCFSAKEQSQGYRPIWSTGKWQKVWLSPKQHTWGSCVTIKRLQQPQPHSLSTTPVWEAEGRQTCVLKASDKERKDSQAWAAGCPEEWAMLGSLGPVLQRPFYGLLKRKIHCLLIRKQNRHLESLVMPSFSCWERAGRCGLLRACWDRLGKNLVHT